jgi:ArsR family transcriptional regulator
MEKKLALGSLSALAHAGRLDIFRLLVQSGPEGLAAGEIAGALDVRPNTLSNNLTVLAASDLVRSRREGRSIRYFARIETMRNLLGFLMQDCCGGRPDLCQPLLDHIAESCPEPELYD